MRKHEKLVTRLMALILLLPLLLCAAFSFAAIAKSAAIAESGVISPQDIEGLVILEDPALIASLEDDLGDVVLE